MEMVDFAASYAKKFHAVVPLGSWTFTGRDGKQISMWKRPLVKNWQSNPIRTESQARYYWQEQMLRFGVVPGIGIATGQISGGYIVIDIDRNHRDGVDGYDTLLDWQLDTGKELPDTWTALTGSGGYHLWYHTDRAMRCFSNPELGIDLRADGGCIAVPPTLHPNGNRYTWEYSPREFECAELDDTVEAFIQYCQPGGYQYAGGGFRPSERRGQDDSERKMLLPPVIDEGGRHPPLISLIGTLNRLGVSDAAIETVVRLENEEKCNPPLTEEELQREVLPAIYRYEKGVKAEAWTDKDNWKLQRQTQNRVAAYLQKEKP